MISVEDFKNKVQAFERECLGSFIDSCETSYDFSDPKDPLAKIKVVDCYKEGWYIELCLGDESDLYIDLRNDVFAPATLENLAINMWHHARQMAEDEMSCQRAEIGILVEKLRLLKGE